MKCTKKDIHALIKQFADSEFADHKVIVFEIPGTNKRLGLWHHKEWVRIYQKPGQNTIRWSDCPTPEWKEAVVIGVADTIDDVLRLEMPTQYAKANQILDSLYADFR